MKTKAQASGLLERNLSFEFRPIAWPIFMKKKITYKFRMATEKIEEEKINLNDATEIIEAMKKLFERISENEVKNFIDIANLFQNERSRSRRRFRQTSSLATCTISFWQPSSESSRDLKVFSSIDNILESYLKGWQQWLEIISELTVSNFSHFDHNFRTPLKKRVSVADIERVKTVFPNQEKTPDSRAFQVEFEVLVQFCHGATCFREVICEGNCRQHQLKQANHIGKLAETATVAVSAAEGTLSRFKFVKNFLKTASIDFCLDSLCCWHMKKKPHQCHWLKQDFPVVHFEEQANTNIAVSS